LPDGFPDARGAIKVKADELGADDVGVAQADAFDRVRFVARRHPAVPLVATGRRVLQVL